MARDGAYEPPEAIEAESSSSSGVRADKLLLLRPLSTLPESVLITVAPPAAPMGGIFGESGRPKDGDEPGLKPVGASGLVGEALQMVVAPPASGEVADFRWPWRCGDDDFFLRVLPSFARSSRPSTAQPL